WYMESSNCPPGLSSNILGSSLDPTVPLNDSKTQMQNLLNDVPANLQAWNQNYGNANQYMWNQWNNDISLGWYGPTATGTNDTANAQAAITYATQLYNQTSKSATDQAALNQIIADSKSMSQMAAQYWNTMSINGTSGLFAKGTGNSAIINATDTI